MRKITIVLLGLLLVFLAAANAGIWWLVEEDPYRVQMTMEGKSQIVLEWGTLYVDPGAKAEARRHYMSADTIPVPVVTTGQVDITQIGTYEIEYAVYWGDRVFTETRVVQVQDTHYPEITLVGGSQVSILPYTEYVEQGYTAWDPYEGDLTDRVVVTTQGDVIAYTVTDASGNTTTVERIITVNDPEPPEITLLGLSEIELSVGGYYQEPGYMAVDNCDGDLTEYVQITDNVNIFEPGTYEIVYEVSDNFGNISQQIRTVRVVNREGIPVGAPNGKNIYLTFDDGPSEYTHELLDVLAKYDIKATFFVVNSKYEDAITRMAQEGHTVGIHSATHRYARIYRSEQAFLADFEVVRAKIQRCTGENPVLFRFPGGSSNTISQDYNKGIITRLASLMTQMGYIYFDWHVDSKDAVGARSREEVFQNVIQGVEKRQDSVVLQHDVTAYSVGAVEKIIRWGLENGYRFLPLTAESPACQHTIQN